jgi:hypothetical protein
MATGEEPNNWGSILNNSVFVPLEEAIAKTLSIVATDASALLLSNQEGDSTGVNHQRFMIIRITGTPGGTKPIEIPTSVTSGVWVIWNETSDSSDIIFRRNGQTGITVASQTIVWAMCNGTDIVAIQVASAVQASNAATADDATTLGGVAAASYARLDVGVNAQEFSAGQYVLRRPLPVLSGTTYKPDLAVSNSFYHLANTSFDITTPANPKDGGQFSLLVKQGTGGNNTIDFTGSAYAFAGGNKPQLTQTLNAFDYFAFEYSSDLGRWLGSNIKNLVGV